MITETGTKADFKHCLLEIVEHQNYPCGHVEVAEYRDHPDGGWIGTLAMYCPRCIDHNLFNVCIRMYPIKKAQQIILTYTINTNGVIWL